MPQPVTLPSDENGSEDRRREGDCALIDRGCGTRIGIPGGGQRKEAEQAEGGCPGIRADQSPAVEIPVETRAWKGAFQAYCLSREVADGNHQYPTMNGARRCRSGLQLGAWSRSSSG